MIRRNHSPDAQLNPRLDQIANTVMKVPALAFTFGILVPLFIGAVQARDDGRYSQFPLKPWFDSLRSGKRPCCSDADGFAVSHAIERCRACFEKPVHLQR
jgi:hypothetical protein